MSKFKKGDTVYIKGFLKEDDKSNIPYGIGLLRETFWAKPEEVFTKQEILAELNKPELPKVGEVYKWKCDGIEVKIVYVNDINLAYAYFENKGIAVQSLDSFYKNFIKVEE